jgi:hypothetical protein
MQKKKKKTIFFGINAFFFFDMSTQEGEEGFKLVTSAS